MNKIRIQSDKGEHNIDVKFLDNPTAKKIIESLPVESSAQTWGDEIYFDIGIKAPNTNPTMEVEVGDIAYWPDGQCLCIFFGKTPASSNDKPVPASNVVIVGNASVNPATLRMVKSGTKVRVE